MTLSVWWQEMHPAYKKVLVFHLWKLKLVFGFILGFHIMGFVLYTVSMPLTVAAEWLAMAMLSSDAIKACLHYSCMCIANNMCINLHKLCIRSYCCTSDTTEYRHERVPSWMWIWICSWPLNLSITPTSCTPMVKRAICQMTLDSCSP